MPISWSMQRKIVLMCVEFPFLRLTMHSRRKSVFASTSLVPVRLGPIIMLPSAIQLSATSVETELQFPYQKIYRRTFKLSIQCVVLANSEVCHCTHEERRIGRSDQHQL